MRIFISYRREDSSGYSGRLYDHLTMSFGEESVFMDTDTIKPGQNFVEIIQAEINRCDVLLAVMGKQWTTVENSDGNLRLQNPNDYVRLEVGLALKLHKLVIPILLENRNMPLPDELPEDLAIISQLNALSVSHERFRSDMTRLVAVLQEYEASAPESKSPLLQPRSPDDHIDLSGEWTNPDGSVDVYFRQHKNRLIGVYRLDGFK
ncbi:MAG TPA: toll/interleukin-1 receptor domain-containing protein, partial [Aggregatilineales bacterium]|nr:toll/interleukin-1 receptor domain-containing protein [Aggregatilineales bacterium]